VQARCRRDAGVVTHLRSSLIIIRVGDDCEQLIRGELDRYISLVHQLLYFEAHILEQIRHGRDMGEQIGTTQFIDAAARGPFQHKLRQR
jgi:hypothetical protein